MGIEDPPNDVAEQRMPVIEDSEDDESDLGDDNAGTPLEADPADVAEQRSEVRFGDPEPNFP
ncbi:MAG: hypothetical protein QOF99_8928 [Pseudonocardiales bacterium]|nr:hypothetical protein [Pseudonocardiales bacterium]